MLFPPLKAGVDNQGSLLSVAKALREKGLGIAFGPPNPKSVDFICRGQKGNTGGGV